MPAPAPMPDVRIDESVSPAALRAGMLGALARRHVDNRFHYVGTRSAERWRALASSHSPAHDDADGLVAYDLAYRAVLGALPDAPVHVIGVASGDGVKEQRLLGALAASGRTGLWASPVDVSVPLVSAAARAMAQVPGVQAAGAVAVDITAVTDLSPLLAPRREGTRVVTLFGVISTLGPGALAPAASLLGAGDLLLVSANLLPDRPGARDEVMAQYDNPPTRDWLAAVLEDIGIADAGPIAFRWDDAPDGPVIVGEVTPAATVVATVDGLEVSMPAGAPIRVLESYRHTPDALARLAGRQGLDLLDVITSPSGEEGVAVARVTARGKQGATG